MNDTEEFWEDVNRTAAAMRGRVENLANAGLGRALLRENAALMGIDLSKPERPKLVAIAGVRLSRGRAPTRQLLSET